MTRAQLLAIYPRLIIHDDPVEIQEVYTYVYATDPTGEFEAVFDANRTVDTVFIYRDSQLLTDFNFSATRAQLLAMFGHPDASGPDRIQKHLGQSGAWDRFDFPDFALHFHYVYKSDQLKLVTVMTRQLVNRITA